MEILQQIVRERGALANIHSAFVDFPQGVEGHYTLYKKIMLEEDLPLTRTEREILAVETSRSNECPYCVGHHKAALENNFESIDKSKVEILEKLAREITEKPWKSSSLKEEFLLTGYSLKQYQHAVFIVSYFNMANRIAFAMDLEIENDYQSSCQ